MKEDNTAPEINCLNCDLPFEERYAYCPNCGQKAAEDLTFGVLFNNTISNYFSYDARFLKSFIPLVLKPGFVAREFIKGRRLKYLHPAQYYLFVSVIFFFLFSISTRRNTENVDNILEKGLENSRNFSLDSLEGKKMDSIGFAKTIEAIENAQFKMDEEDRKILDSLKNSGGNFNTSFNTVDGVNLGQNELRKLDSLIKIEAPEEEKLAIFGVNEETGMFNKFMAKQALKLYESSGKGILNAFYDTIPISMFFLIPIFALILKILYFKRTKFAHSMVFSFYYFTFLFIVLSLMLLINYIIDIPNWIDWLIGLSTFIYLWISLKRFYEQGYFVSFMKLGILSFVYISFIVPLSLVIMMVVAFATY